MIIAVCLVRQSTGHGRGELAETPWLCFGTLGKSGMGQERKQLGKKCFGAELESGIRNVRSGK